MLPLIVGGGVKGALFAGLLVFVQDNRVAMSKTSDL
jgi:hypothetical protein